MVPHAKEAQPQYELLDAMGILSESGEEELLPIRYSEAIMNNVGTVRMPGLRMLFRRNKTEHPQPFRSGTR